MKPGLTTHAFFGLSLCVMFAGCDGRTAAVSTACAKLANATDPARKAELVKKCPRGGPVFKPSEKKQW
jgi:entry exclusion lipoprotein TrbK